MEDERTQKQAYLRKEIIEATGVLITDQSLFKNYESKEFKSQNSTIPFSLEFKNMTKSTMTYFWFDEDKSKRGETKLQPNTYGTMDTFVGNPWVIEGPTGLIATYMPTMDVKQGEFVTVTTDKEFKTTVKKDFQTFVDYMTKAKYEGDDIDNWELEE